MALSPYFEDSDIISQLRCLFGVDEQWTIDFQSLLSQVEDVDDEFLELKIKTRKFRIHKILGMVEEVK